jgi:hypothetical protein
MPNFSAIVRRSYADIDGLLLDCRNEDIPADVGTHNGVSNSAILSDSTAAWTVNALVGGLVHNTFDGSSGPITANTGTTITAVLGGGTDNDWDFGDAYSVVLPTGFEWVNSAPPARAKISGTHTGPNFSATLIDAAHTWQDNELTGRIAYNLTVGVNGFVVSNTAHVVTTAGMIWMTGDVYDLTTPRFGNPYQPTVALCPIPMQLGGPLATYEARFIRANTNRLILPLEYSVPVSFYSAAFDVASIGADAANNQTLFGLPNYEIYRRTAAGVRAYRHNITTCSGAADLSFGAWVQQGRYFGGAFTGQLWNNGVLDFASTDGSLVLAAGNPAGYIGCNSAAANHVDLDLRSMQLWRRCLGDLEVDFAFRTISAIIPWNVQPYCDVEMNVWTDDTNQNVAPFTGLLRRINPVQNVPQRFYRATFAAGVASRIQLAAMISEMTLTDFDLGGNLFQWIPMEYPGVTPPAMYTTAGVSAVCDMLITTEGHYTVQCYRPNGGSVILHVDAESV